MGQLMKVSRRCQKLPVTRRDDFLCTTTNNCQGRKRGKIKIKPKSDMLSVHHNVQSINNKLLELAVLLHSELESLDVICFSEHWLKEEYKN